MNNKNKVVEKKSISLYVYISFSPILNDSSYNTTKITSKMLRLKNVENEIQIHNNSSNNDNDFNNNNNEKQMLANNKYSKTISNGIQLEYAASGVAECS